MKQFHRDDALQARSEHARHAKNGNNADNDDDGLLNAFWDFHI